VLQNVGMLERLTEACLTGDIAEQLEQDLAHGRSTRRGFNNAVFNRSFVRLKLKSNPPTKARGPSLYDVGSKFPT
jgi:hypothetical protein